MKDAIIKPLILIAAMIASSSCSNYNILRKQPDAITATQSEKINTDEKTTSGIRYERGNLEYLELAPNTVTKIAVLLPQDNSFREISVAIRDGLISAWFDNHTQNYKPELFFFSTSESLRGIVEAIEKENIDFVIGPLRKAMIPRVEDLLPEDVGMLALNVEPSSMLANSQKRYQFGLTPEDEAIQVAKKARKTGKRMLLIAPRSEWGLRMSDAYKNTWDELNGQVASEMYFDPGTSNYSAIVKRSLSVDSSYSRRNLIRSLLGTKIEFEARRRKDIDVVILAANEPEAKQILPQLRFHKAENIPIFSSSHVFSNFSYRDNNRDLEGLTFGDAPWITAEENFFLRKTLEEIDHPANEYPRLFAFGRDAFSILPFLNRMEQSPNLRVPGATGNLWLDSDKVIHRDLRWFYFKNGRPRWQSIDS